MSNLLKLLSMGFLLIPFVSNSQSISANLEYINEQFSQYNGYETYFRIDEYNKELICTDKFGTLKAKFADIEIRIKGKNIGIFCLNSEYECIRTYDELGKLKAASRKDYTMGLRQNEELIPHISTVLNKFAEIKSIVLGNSGNGNSNSNSEVDIETEISNINAIFQRSSQHNNIWSFDYSQNAIIGKTENCEIIVPVNSGLSINSYVREGNYGNGWYFKNTDESIIESCTSFKNNTTKTYEYVNSAADASRVISSFNKIINLAKNRSNSVTTYSTSNPNSGSGSGTVAGSLAYINAQFEKYNAYNTRFSIDNTTKKIIWTHDFGTNYAYLKDVEIKADNANSWIGVYCLSGEKCIWQISTSDKRSDYKEYTMSLLEDKKMIGHMNTLIQEFEALKRLSLGNTNNISSSNNEDSDSPD